ncbi:MAG: penicillin-binding protein 2 [Helicobacteraceae bacterium]|jgi:penicillin-binding protein 2|nr:penicillin-binding protein 2 [Helicobacteraceae bacterium]
MRMRLLISFFSVVWLSLLIRVFYLSVHSNSYYSTLSSHNTIKTEKIAPIRGEIHDRDGRPIAINKLGFSIKLQPHLKTKGTMNELDEAIKLLVSYLPELNATKIRQNYILDDSYYNHHDIRVVDFISYEKIMPVYSPLHLNDHILVIPAPKRHYPYNSMAAHVIGYVAKANVKDVERDDLAKLIGFTGKNGIEKYYNSYLEGLAGERKVKVSAQNEVIEVLSKTKAIESRDLTLTLDMRLQEYVSEHFNAQAGAVIIMGVNGEILAAGSFPEYDLNTFVSGISTAYWKELINDIDTPFTNKLINGLYPPGSTIKTGLGLVYLSSGINQWWNVNCVGTMKLGKRNFRCWKHSGHGTTDIRKAIRESCDDYFYKASLKVGIANMSYGLKQFGLGSKTGVDLPNEFIGTVPNREWKRKRFNQPWYIGETLNTSIGQGDFLTTPLQMAQYTALMATGQLVTPHLAKQIGDEEYLPEYKDVLTPEQHEKLPIIQQAMRQVCQSKTGTASHFLHSKVPMAGKTGTAQVIGISQEVKQRINERDMKYYTRSHAWFTTYAPADDPQYIVTVLVEHGGHGGVAAGGMVSDIYDKMLELGYIKGVAKK